MCFYRVKTTVKNYKSIVKNKLVAVHGDISKDGFGMKKEDLIRIKNEVNIIYHYAAITDFFLPLNVIVNSNVSGGLRMLELARSCKNLDTHIHVSTYFNNCHLGL